MPTPDPLPPPRFILVHGTWAPQAGWTKPDSALCRALRERFGEQAVIERVGWGGWNNVGTRHEGMQKVADRLLSRPPPPGAPREILIGHSHGGNVVLAALRRPAVAARVAGVVTMATPFLMARRRRLSPLIKDVPLLLLTPLVLLAFWGVASVIDRLALGALGWLVLALVMLAFGASVVVGIRGYRGFCADVLRKMRLARPPPQRVLILRSPGDEASALLQAARLALSVGLVLFSLAAALYRRVDRLLHWAQARPWRAALLLVPAAVLWLGGLAAAYLAAWPLWAVLGVAAVLLVLLLLPPAAILAGHADMARLYWEGLLSVLLLLGMALPSLGLIFYGWQLPLANFMLDVNAEATPPGEWTVTTLRPAPPLGDERAAVLTHSALYDDSRALDKLCDWVEQRLNAAQAGG